MSAKILILAVLILAIIPAEKAIRALRRHAIPADAPLTPAKIGLRAGAIRAAQEHR